jgi:hypothetical protein
MSALANRMVCSVGAALFVLAPTANGQSIADRIGDAEDGKVRMSYAARAGVCGDGRHSVSFDGGRGWDLRLGKHDRDWEPVCEYGPVRVVLKVRDRRVTEVDSYVGGRWTAPTRSTVDLGTVSAPEASRYFLDLARSAEGDVGAEALFPAMVADSVTVWPELLEMARDRNLRESTRKSATFWLSQEAAAAATDGLAEIAEDEQGDRDIRMAAVFGLSQRPRDEGVPILIRIATTNDDPEIRKQALFWLGQSDDPRAVELFEELLTKG